jgi:hypothetical protein
LWYSSAFVCIAAIILSITIKRWEAEAENRTEIFNAETVTANDFTVELEISES